MIRDHKFQRTEWTPHKKRRIGRRSLLRAVVLVALIGLGYALYLWSSAPLVNAPLEPGTRVSGDTQVIPLEIPRNKHQPAESGPRD